MKEENLESSVSDIRKEIENLQPSSEQIAKQHLSIGMQESKQARDERQLDARSIARRLLDPMHWEERRDLNKSKTNTAEHRKELEQTAREVMDQMHAEALDYVNAYEEYETVNEELTHELDLSVKPLNMDEFIREFDTSAGKAYGDWPILSDHWTLGRRQVPKGEQERSTFFKERGKLLALQDIFTPHLPVVREELDVSYSREPVVNAYSNLPGLSGYRSGRPGDRFPRLDIGHPRSEALSKAEENSTNNLLEFTNTVAISLQDPIVERRYVLISDRVKEILGNQVEDIGNIGNRVDICRGERMMAGGIGYLPIGGIEYSARVVETRDLKSGDLDKSLGDVALEDTGDASVPVLIYDAEDIRDGTMTPSQLKLPEDLDEARDLALQTVVDAEMNPQTAHQMVRNARVRMPDGSIVSWHEFTNPALQKQSKAS